MAGTITLSVDEWRKIKDRLRLEHPLSVLVLVGAMKRELGFTVRNHKEYPNDEDEVIYDKNGSWSYYREVICLDFYDDIKETYFRLRYL